jgi:hypothetical protein
MHSEIVSKTATEPEYKAPTHILSNGTPSHLTGVEIYLHYTKPCTQKFYLKPHKSYKIPDTFERVKHEYLGYTLVVTGGTLSIHNDPGRSLGTVLDEESRS